MDKVQSKTTRKSTQTTQTNPVIKTQFNLAYKGAIGEINTLPSLTEPDMSLSILELLTNHSRGISSDVHISQPEFFGTEIPRFDDITEEIEYKESLKDQLQKAEQLAKDEHEHRKQQRITDAKTKKDLDLLNAKKLLQIDSDDTADD